MRLVLQRGHVGRTRGSTGAAGEQELATRIAARVVELAPATVEVVVIDADEPTHRYRGDAFVALHGDASENEHVGGASVGWRTPAGKELGDRWKVIYQDRGWPGGFRDDNYTTNLARYYGTGRALTAGNHRAVILEHGFLTNPSERAWLESAEGITTAAVAILEAVTGRRVQQLDTDHQEQEQDTMTEEQAKQLDDLHRELIRERPNVSADLALIRRGVRAIAYKLGVPVKHDDHLERVDA